MKIEEVALQLQEQSGQRVGIALDIVKLIIIDTENLAEVAQKRLALEYKYCC